MQHEMKLAKVPFDKIADGSKTVESRLFDEKRQTISLGDEITFRLNDEPSAAVTKKVVALHRYPTFEAMMRDLPAARFGWEAADQAITEINAFYSEDDQQKFGVVGIALA